MSTGSTLINPDKCIESAKTMSIVLLLITIPLINAVISQTMDWRTLQQARKIFITKFIQDEYQSVNGDISKLKGRFKVIKGIGDISIDEAIQKGNDIAIKAFVMPDTWFLDEKKVPIWGVNKVYHKDTLESLVSNETQLINLNIIAASYLLDPTRFNSYVDMYREIEWTVYKKIRFRTVGIPGTPITINWDLAGWVFVIAALSLLISIKSRLTIVKPSIEESSEPWLILDARGVSEKTVAILWSIALCLSPLLAIICVGMSEQLYSIFFRGDIEETSNIAFLLIGLLILIATTNALRLLKLIKYLHKKRSELVIE